MLTSELEIPALDPAGAKLGGDCSGFACRMCWRSKREDSYEAIPPSLQIQQKYHILSTMAGPNPNAHGAHPIHIHPVRPLYRVAARGLGASMWFFLMYRAYHDGQALLGLKHPWDH